ncbi:MAG: LptF/LptG family permease [Fervidobacterium sp.]
MRVLTRYVLKQSLKPFVMGLVGFIVFVSVEWLYQISDYIIRNRVGIDKLLVFVMYNIPYFTFLGIPVGVLFSIFWVISDMYNNREITALLVHGISSKSLVVPFVILALILGFFSWLLGDFVVPTANYKSSQILNQYIFQSPESIVKTNTLVELEKDLYFYVKEYNKQKGELYDVVLFRNEEGNEQILTAKRVVKMKDGWFLLDGSMYVVELESGFLKLEMQFKEMKLDVAGEIEEMLRSAKTTRDKTSKELREQLETYKKLGINTANLVVELQQRYANALGALVIVLIGLPVSLLFGFTSRSWSIIVTFIIVVLYQGSGAWLSGMGKEGYMDPVLATWLPNIVFTIVGSIMYILIDTPIAFRVREFLTRLFIIFIILASVITFTSSTSFAGNQIFVRSQDFYVSESMAIFKGTVSFAWDNYKLYCDEASATIIDGKVKSIEASGDVKFYDKDRLYRARNLRYDFESEKALMVQAKTVYNYKYNNKNVLIYVYSSTVEYDTSNSLGFLENSYITTCDFEEPHYMILSSEIYVLENKYIIAKNSFLVVLGVPIFPYPLYITTLEGVPPYSFSISFGQTLNISQTFSFLVNDWAISISTGFNNVSFNFEDTKNKLNKLTYDQVKKTIEFSLATFTYRYSNGIVYYKYDGPVYLEGNYYNDSNYYQKLGINLQNQNVYVRPYIMYDGKLNDTVILLNGGLKNLSFNLFADNILNLTAVDSTYKLQTDGYLFEQDSSKIWSMYYKTLYDVSLSSKSINYNLSVSGNVYKNAENRNILYTFQFPWNYKDGPFSLNFNYTFSVKSFYNYANSKAIQSLGTTDKYTVIGNYSFGPFKTSLSWDQTYNFLDESTTTNKNLVKISLESNAQDIAFSVNRTWDVLNEKLLPDNLTLRYSQVFSGFEFNGSLTTSYDNTLKKIGNENVSFGISCKPLTLSYTLQFTIQPDKPLDVFVHTIKYSNLSITAYQQADYVKNLIASGSFNLFDYKSNLKLNYTKTSKDAEPVWNFTYTMEKKDEKYTLSYNNDGKKTYKTEINLKTFDPYIKLGLTFNPSTNSLDYFSLNIDKSLHCWRLNFGVDFTNRNATNIIDNIDKIYIKFYLTDITDKFFEFDPKNGTFNFSGM